MINFTIYNTQITPIYNNTKQAVSAEFRLDGDVMRSSVDSERVLRNPSPPPRERQRDHNKIVLLSR